MASKLVREQIKHLPADPGVYLMKDATGRIIYVGKAASLRSRIRSYFSTKQGLSPKLKQMVAKVNTIDFFITGSEQEALILENTLIKTHHPHYNVRLKDDKTFPYLKISLNEEWPRVYVTRTLKEDGGRYFGPFAGAKSVRQTLKVLQGIFPFRSCSRTITGNDQRPCLEYHIHRCPAPCIGAISKEEYAEAIRQIILFLDGKEETIFRRLQTRMKEAAAALDFEQAALLRNQIQAIERVIEGQRIATRVRGEQDAIALAQDEEQACAQVFFIRRGRLVGKESFAIRSASPEEPAQIMSSFVIQFYSSAAYIPPRLLLQHPVDDKPVIEAWLQSKRGTKVSIRVPHRGNQKKLMEIAAANAEHELQQLKIKQQATSPVLEKALAEIERELHLPHPPLRIEGYDISNIQGRLAVGSMVVFENGKPKPAHYRRFRIKTVAEANDYAMMQEILRRRFKKGAATKQAADSWATLPDLVLIDGGKGQLSTARAAMKAAGADFIPAASLAKEREELFIPRQRKAITLPGSSPGLQLLQRVRDEAHRFALSYHHRIRRRETFTSNLDNIPGIGAKRKRALLQRFGSVRAIREASPDELATTEGISRGLAQKLKGAL